MEVDLAKFWTDYGKELLSGTSTILGAIFGAGFTVIGVHMTNRSNQRTIQKQLQHEKELRRRDYEMNLRRDVYLGLAELVGAQLDLVSKLNHFDKTNQELFEQVLSLTGNEAKVHVVAGTDVLRELALISQDYGETQQKLVAERNRIGKIHSQLLAQRTLVSEETQKVQLYVDLMAKLDIDGEVDGRKRKAVNANFEQHQQFQQSYSNQASVLSSQFHEELVLFTVRCNEERLRLSSRLGPLVAAVRKELELDIDPTEYGKLQAIAKPYTTESVRKLFNLPAESSTAK